MKQKRVVILGGGGFIGGHLGKRLKSEGCHVRICDIKKHEYFFHSEICDEFIVGDLRDPKTVELVIEEGVDEVYKDFVDAQSRKKGVSKSNILEMIIDHYMQGKI